MLFVFNSPDGSKLLIEVNLYFYRLEERPKRSSFIDSSKAREPIRVSTAGIIIHKKTPKKIS
jgi:hypothetical protein